MVFLPQNWPTAFHPLPSVDLGIGDFARVDKYRPLMGVNDDVLDVLLRKARTHNAWLPKPVPDDLILQLYDALKWGPTSGNISPARFLFLRSAAAQERLRSSLSPGNVGKTMAAPVTVIVAYDLKFYDKLPRLFLHAPAMRDMFANNPQMIEEAAKRNSSSPIVTPNETAPSPASRTAWLAIVDSERLLTALRLSRNSISSEVLAFSVKPSPPGSCPACGFCPGEPFEPSWRKGKISSRLCV